MYISIRFEEIL